jgi:hypothetical protein
MVEGYINGATMPSSSDFRVVLTNGVTLSRTTAVGAITGAEISGNGYSRQTYNPGAGSYADPNYSLPQVDATFTASGGTLTYDGVAILADASGATSVFAVGNISPAVTIADGNSGVVRIDYSLKDTD